MDIVDLRSDTFTLQDEGMRRAIYAAEVGNSGFGEDPSVNRLQDTIADYFGMEAGIFVPSATMAGQIAFKVWTRPGDFIVIEEYGHGYYFESGAMGAISGILPRLVKGVRGILQPADVRAAIDHVEYDFNRAALVVLENTANWGGGTVYPRTVLDELYSLSVDEQVPVHVDGARIWNAIVATGADPTSLVPPGGSMSVCFSKGLGAPMGALLLGEKEFIQEAKRMQAILGGVMRQVGFMAAGALYGFQKNLGRLADDHANAKRIAELIAPNPKLELDPAHVETNILYFQVKEGPARAARLAAELDQRGIRAWALKDLIRIVTSLNVDRSGCERAAACINELLT
jgi:threonine aldolase